MVIFIMSNFLTVQEVAEKLEISPDTVRRWEKKGLVRAKRSENNYRLFDVETVKRLKNKLSGVSTENNYRIFKSKKTPYVSIDLFAGAGGTALGLENAGFKHKLLVEFDKGAAATMRANRPKWNVLQQDIAEIDFTEYRGQVDVVEGGFPCQSFSYAGKQLGFGDIRGTLFFEFARCVKEVRPKIAVGENVKGLIKHEDGRTLSTMIGVLEEIGYKVTWKLLRSQYLDVPQKRERLVIIAVRNDLDIPILFPKEKDYTISIKEALDGCPKSDGQEYPKKKKEILTEVPAGGYWRDLPIEMQKEYMGVSYYRGGGKTGMARRLSWNEPSLTLTCSPAQKHTERCHPEETRPLNVREYARIQTFPDDWVFCGSIASKYRQIGNAVPVNLGYHIGRCLVAMLDGKHDRNDMETIDQNSYQQSMGL